MTDDNHGFGRLGDGVTGRTGAPDDLVDGALRHNDPYIELTLSMRSSTWNAMLAAMPQSPERRALFNAMRTAKAQAEARVGELNTEIANLNRRRAELEDQLSASELEGLDRG